MSSTDEICPTDKYVEHMSAFDSAFVLRERPERWLHLLANAADVPNRTTQLVELCNW